MPNLLEQTLAEQLNVTDHEIEYRKHLFDLSEVDGERLRACLEFIEKRSTDLVRKFYEQQVVKPEVASLIGDSDTLQRLRNALVTYVIELFSGPYDRDYVNKRLRIGKVHRHMQVTPKVYMSSVRLLQSLLDEALREWAQGRPESETEGVIESLHKVLFFDAQFVFDAYIDSYILDVDLVKGEVEGYANKLNLPVGEHVRELRDISTRDTLTKLYNHRYLYDLLQRELGVAERHKLPLSLIYLDLNGFKAVNDREGHQRGDQVLCEVAKAMCAAVRTIDICCRYGGDEFCIILPRTIVDEAKLVCDRLPKLMRERLGSGVSFSAGIVQTGPEEFLRIEELVSRADALMYEAKAIAKSTPGFHIKTSPDLQLGDAAAVA